MPNRFNPTPKQIDDAVSKALEYNSKSTVMYLFRERLIREIVEVIWPMAQVDLIQKVLELESEIMDLRGGGGVNAEPESPRGKKLRDELVRMKNTIEEQQANA